LATEEVQEERWISHDTWKVIDERKRIKQRKSQRQLTKEQLADLEEDSNSAVKVNGDMSSWFQVITGARQGCSLPPLLFAITTDWVLRRSTERSAGGIT